MKPHKKPLVAAAIVLSLAFLVGCGRHRPPWHRGRNLSKRIMRSALARHPRKDREMRRSMIENKGVKRGITMASGAENPDLTPQTSLQIQMPSRNRGPYGWTQIRGGTDFLERTTSRVGHLWLMVSMV